MTAQPVEPVRGGRLCLCGHDALDHYGLGDLRCDHRACGCLRFRLDTRSTR